MGDVTVRFFAAAEEAAGEAETTWPLAGGATLGGLLDELVRAKPALAGVLPSCSYLYNSVAARDPQQRLSPGGTVDVLPPFSGG
ncbi:MAG: MoaD/ThiS family protein [Segniliparus sp.]|uniref:MoaD/ThiS family protein n=1 Tax=Segniliparus sp. TaxID=2804064 RepID=UPI003F30EBD2